MKVFCLLLLFCLIFLYSCMDKQERFVQPIFDDFQKEWVVDSFTIEGNVPDSLDIIINGGILVLRKCKYDTKNFNKGQVCGGDFYIDKIRFPVTYTYIYDKKIYLLKFSIYDSDPSFVDNAFSKHVVIINLVNGEWDIVTEGDKLTARQIKNYKYPNMNVHFTARRK
jgi:hypothetical protein